MASSRLSTLQDFPWEDSIWAVKSSVEFKSFRELREHLLAKLPHNSPQTRLRYTELITRRYFPERSVDNLLTQVWRHYRDEPILTDLMRVVTLEIEPAIASFVVEELLTREPGAILDPEVPRAFVETAFGEFKRRSYDRLLLSSRYLGFVGRYNKTLVVEEIRTPADAMLILLHDRLAPTPRIVRLAELLEGNWWRYIGLRSPDAVREVLRRGEAAGLLSRYVVVDELEQVTTRFSRDEYIVKALRL
jgi:hypothetical protein